MVAEVGAREGVAVEVVERDHLVGVDESMRASVVPMKPAPPVIRILLPLRATRRV